MSRWLAARFGGLSFSLATITAVVALLVNLVPASALADSGITGRILSAETGEPLGFANVVYVRTDPGAGAKLNVAQGTISNGDGTYRVSTAPGQYRLEAHYIGYATFEVTDVVVEEGKFAVIDFPLPTEAIQVETVKVTAKALRDTNASLLAKRRKAVAVSDGISAQQIRESTDSNAAEAVTRVTGLSVVGGKYVYVRGLGERYSSAQLNGSVVGSPEANRRVLPLDLFPSSLLDNVVIQKTYTPDQPGEFGGGAVNITTLDFPSNETWSLSFKGGANGITTGDDFATYEGGKTDWLGVDDGIREMPALLKEIANDDLIKAPGSILNPGAYTAEEIEAMGRSFNKIWTPSAKNGPPLYNFSAVYGNLVPLFSRDLGFVVSVSQGNTFHRLDYVDRSFIDGDPEVVLKDDLNAVRSVAETQLGGLVNGAYRLDGANTLRFNANYTRTSHDEVRLREGSIDNDDEIVREAQLRYIERDLATGTVGMDHQLRWLGNTEVDWKLSYSEADRTVPDRRFYRYEEQTRNGVSQYELQAGQGVKAPNRWFEGMNDIDRNAKVDVSVPFKQWSGLETKLKAGYAYRNKDRESELRRFYYKGGTGVGALDLTAPVNEILIDDNIGGRAAGAEFALTEWTREVDGYTATQDLTAWYGMMDLPVTDRLLLVAGARVEDSRQEVVTVHRLWADVYDPDIGLIDKTDVLPAASLRYSLGETTNLRLGYSETLNRPDLRELSSGEWEDSDRARKFVGNADLQQAQLTNYDLRIEWFPSADELLAASAFYKDLGQPIEYAVRVATGSNDPIYQPVNATEGHIRGLEFESRVGLGRVGGGLMERLGVSANVTLIDSEAKLPPELGEQADNQRPLTGQSEYMVNAGVFYRSEGGSLSSGVQYNTFGRRIEAIGVLSTPNIWEEPRHTLDFTSTYRWGMASLKFSFENLLDSPVRYTQGGQDTQKWETGRTVTLAVGYGNR